MMVSQIPLRKYRHIQKSAEEPNSVKAGTFILENLPSVLHKYFYSYIHLLILHFVFSHVIVSFLFVQVCLNSNLGVRV